MTSCGLLLPVVGGYPFESVASQLGADFARVRQSVLSWNGQNVVADRYRDAGLDIMLVLRHCADGVSQASYPGDMAAYRGLVGDIVAAIEPAVVVIENEPDVVTFWSGTAAQYVDMLHNACDVIDRPVAGGPISHGGIAVGVYLHYLDALADAVAADDFAQRVANTAGEYAALTNPASLTAFRTLETFCSTIYSGLVGAGCSFADFHHYATDASTLPEAVDVYVSPKSGLPVLSSEIGQRDGAIAATVTERIAASKEIDLEYLSWYTASNETTDPAFNLTDLSGGIRDNGFAFRDAIAPEQVAVSAPHGRADKTVEIWHQGRAVA